MSAFWVRIGAILGGLAVTFGAFGAHGLKGTMDPKSLETFETAAKYQMYHALALVAVGLLGLTGRPGPGVNAAGSLFLVGTLLFSGALYALAFGGPRQLGRFAPIGGLFQIAGWLALAGAAGGKSIGETRSEIPSAGNTHDPASD